MGRFDTDEECRNPDIIQKKWEWYEQAFYATRSISEPTLIAWCGNIIAKDCFVVRAAAFADSHDIVNIRDREGHSTWPEKNTEQHIDETLSKISTVSAQKEYFNNPISEGEVFKEITWGKIPPLKRLPYLVNYGDHAPGEHSGKGVSTKSCILMGMLADRLYIIQAKLDHGLNSDFIQWYIDHELYVGGRVPVYHYMENNKFQDPFFQQVFKPLMARARRKQKVSLFITPDQEKKTDKATRIEANLEPLNRDGRLIFNEAEKDNPHMKRLVEQMKGYLQGRYDCDAIFSAAGTALNQLVLMMAIDIALYHIFCAHNPQKLSQVRQDRYDRALEWLKKVSENKLSIAGTPALDEDDQTPSWMMSSNPHRTQHL